MSFVPDTGTLFYIKRKPVTKVVDSGFTQTVVVVDVEDRSFITDVLECIVSDPHLVIAKKRHGSVYGENLVKLRIPEWNFQPASPEVLEFLKTTKEWIHD